MLDIELPATTTRRRQGVPLPALEWSGCVLALLGAGLLSLNNSASAYGFGFFLGSNLCLLAAARRRASTPLFLMQVGFTLTSLNGLRTWLLS
jgi:hypothetical protein